MGLLNLNLPNGSSNLDLYSIYQSVKSLFNNFLYKTSIPKAPTGAAVTIAITATDKTIFPHARPAASGTEPIAACTVALGR